MLLVELSNLLDVLEEDALRLAFELLIFESDKLLVDPLRPFFLRTVGSDGNSFRGIEECLQLADGGMRIVEHSDHGKRMESRDHRSNFSGTSCVGNREAVQGLLVLEKTAN